jgi:hypothetical protein
MFNSWRINLREADTAYRQGRYDDAIRLLAEDETSRSLPIRRLAARLTETLLERARRRMLAGEMTESWQDLKRITAVSGECERSTTLRDELVECVLTDCRDLLRAGELTRCLAKLDDIQRRGYCLESVTTLREDVRRVHSADQLAQCGRFAEAIRQLNPALAGGEISASHLSGRLSDYRYRLGVSRELVEQLHRAMVDGEWTQAVGFADRLLEIAPLCALAKDARKQAWAHAGTPLSTTAISNENATLDTASSCDGENEGGENEGGENEGGNHNGGGQVAVVCSERLTASHSGSREPNREAESQVVSANDRKGAGRGAVPPEMERFFLWVDGVGGYLVCPADAITLGQAVPMAGVDVPILGDVSRRHAAIRRSGEGYVLEPIAEVTLNGKIVERSTVLRDGDLIRMSAVEMRFRQPHALSSTVRLDFVSRHGTQPSVDGVILLADSCVLGPRKENHVICRDWEHDLVLFRKKEQLYCRAVASFEVDGQLVDGHANLRPGSQVCGDDFSISLEPMRS